MASPGPSPSSRTATGASFKTSSSRFGCRHDENARNLIVCIDGTANKFGQNNTNVVKLFADLNHDSRTEQYAYYSSGIGTNPKSLSIWSSIQKTFHVAIAWNVEEIVKDAYGWLAEMYEEKDRIFLFGFSRGAYQARVLAAMIYEVGLIKTATDKQIETAYNHYKDMQSGRAKARQIAREFKRTFSWEDLCVHFVGVWDTVSSVGLVKEDVFLSTSLSAAHACHFRHALALDERRVKFMPEYLHEMNSLINVGKSKYLGYAIMGDRKCDVNDNGIAVTPGEPYNTTSDVKEVWFPGSHSDVGGTNRPGNSHQAGNVSFLWMRKEATLHGLALKQTDMVWVPDDLDFGISNPMGYRWKAIEYLPIKHQVSFSGAGENKRRPHCEKPRRILPGQKVHASILYSNAYRPQATLGMGFEIPITFPGLEDMDLDPSIWETGLFDDTAGTQLLQRLDSGDEVAPIYLDRLLFLLRFKEGKKCVGGVCGLNDKLKNIVTNPGCPELVRLVSIVTYYEASCDAGPHTKCVSIDDELFEAVFEDAKKALRTVLAKENHPEGPRVVALLAPLTRHQVLRQKLLTPKILNILVKLLDSTVANVKQSSRNFVQAMNGLTYLLQYEDTRRIIIDRLAVRYPNSTKSRLSRILDVDNSHPLTLAALRMALTLAHVSKAKDLWTAVKPRLGKLAKKSVGPVGSLAVEILLVLYEPNVQSQLDIRNANLRANLASVLLRWNPDAQDSDDSSASVQVRLPNPLVCLKRGGRDPNTGSNLNEDLGQETLRRLFGLAAHTLGDEQKKFILQLRLAVRYGTAPERTASTMTLLKLLESKVIRAYLREIKLLDVFVRQLKYEDSALLAAYALAIYMTYNDMMRFIMDNEHLPKNVVGMLQKDYFDDAIGQVEGFEIFRSLMQYEDLREKIEEHPIANILAKKLGKGDPKEIRTSLICLDIFWSFNTEGSWCSTLVEKSLEHLRESTWEKQKAGVMILSALVQTEHGEAAIDSRIIEIVEMLLPRDYRRLQASRKASSTSVILRKIRLMLQKSTTASSSEGEEPPPISWMMGPACALHVLAQNKRLRTRLRRSPQYNSLKSLHLSGSLVYTKDTSSLRVTAPNRTDVESMLDKLIKIVEEDPEDEAFKSIEDIVLPRVWHSSRLATQLENRMKDALILLGGLTIGVLALTVVVPAYVVPRVCKRCKRVLARIQFSYILHWAMRKGGYNGPSGGARQGGHAGSETHPVPPAGVEVLGGHDGRCQTCGHLVSATTTLNGEGVIGTNQE